MNTFYNFISCISPYTQINMFMEDEKTIFDTGKAYQFYDDNSINEFDNYIISKVYFIHKNTVNIVLKERI